MRAVWHVRTNVLVLAWGFAAAVVAAFHREIPQSEWLMVHLLLLGAVSTAIHIWSAHFAEAVRRRPLPGGRRGQALRLGLHTAGALTVVVGLLTGRVPVVIGGAVAVGAAAVWHATVLVLQGRGSMSVRLAWTAWYFVVASLAMPIGAGLGTMLARPDLEGELHARTYVAHVSVMILGWVGLTVVGTMVTLWPTMLRVQLADDARSAAQQGLALLGAGLLAMVGGTLTGALPVTGAGMVLYLLGLLRTSWPLLAEARRRMPDTFASRSVGVAWVWLLLTVAVWAVLVLTAAEWTVAQPRVTSLLGPLVVGFAAQVLIGALSHLGPMVVGGGPSAVRAARAVVERGGTARLVLVNAGLVLYLLPVPSLVRVGTSVLVLGALVAAPVLLVRAVVVARRRRSDPQTGPAAGRAVAEQEKRPPVDLLKQRHRPLGPTLAAVGALSLVVAGAVAADPASVGLGDSSAAGVEASGRLVEVEVEARDMRFFPASVEVEAGDELVLVVTNTDTMVHDLVLDSGVSSGRLAPGATARVEVGVVGRALDGWCSVAGHRQMGMVFSVEVTGLDGGGSSGGSVGAGDPGGHEHGDHGGAAGPSAAQDLDFMAEPGPGFTAYDPVLPPASGTPGEPTVHEVTLEVSDLEQEVAPGVRQTLWTFGGTAPGPTLRGRVGDRFEITLVNDGTIGHSIDFHAGALAPDRPMRTIEPGESLTYSFTATRSGIWMYHCSTMPMSLHIANGMFGAVVIDPPDLPAVDREYLLIQSELYLGEQGGIADADKIMAERPDAVVFNGYANQYGHERLAARVGERVRIWVLDVGPNRSSAFHVVGGQFDTVYLEGVYRLGGPDGVPGDGQGTGGSQVLGLHVAQGGFVELVLPEAGNYPFVSHVMVDAERGAHGYVTVTE